MKSLAKDTAIYGLSSIVGKFLNWLLTPLYVYKISENGNGEITNLYAWMALLLITLTYGMETGFFRFVNQKEEYEPDTVYSTSLFSLAATSLLFIGIVFLFINPISSALGYFEHKSYILMLAVIIALDAFSSIPFAFLRYKNKALKFAEIKFLFIFLNIILNLFFLIACPFLYKHYEGTVSWFFEPGHGVKYVIVANLIGTFLMFLALVPTFIQIKFKVDFALLKKMLSYSFPLLILGLAGILTLNGDKILFTSLVADQATALSQLGIYGANYKIAIIMVMFTQAFRFAYEPFIFAKSKGAKDKESYAMAMKFFIIFSLLIFLGVMFYLDIIKYLIKPSYYEGLRIVPIVMFAQIFFGIFFNLSLWYKLTDKTMWGAVFSIVGCVLTIGFNVLLVPRYGYMGCAWASFITYLFLMIISYGTGQKYYPISYDLKSIFTYTAIALVLYLISINIPIENIFLRLSFKTFLLFLYIAYLIKKDIALSEIPVLNKIFHKGNGNTKGDLR